MLFDVIGCNAFLNLMLPLRQYAMDTDGIVMEPGTSRGYVTTMDAIILDSQGKIAPRMAVSSWWRWWNRIMGDKAHKMSEVMKRLRLNESGAVTLEG